MKEQDKKEENGWDTWYPVDSKIRNCEHRNMKKVKVGNAILYYCLDCKLHFKIGQTSELLQEKDE